MAQCNSNIKPNTTKQSDHICTLLYADGKGWNTSLFQNPSKASAYSCEHCGSVCRDAVELDCDHALDDICLYCKQCLTQLIEANDNQCILNPDHNASISASRIVQSRVLKLNVICPFSSEYENQSALATNHIPPGNQLIVTSGSSGLEDQKEGDTAAPTVHDQNHCQWKGTLKELIHTHIRNCLHKSDSQNRLKWRVQCLEAEIERLLKIIQAKDDAMASMKLQIEKYSHESKEEALDMDAVKNSIETNTQRYQRMLSSDFRFIVPAKHAMVLSVSDDIGSTLSYKGSWTNVDVWCAFGRTLSGNDKVTVHFEHTFVGSGYNIRFGFASPQCLETDVLSDYILITGSQTTSKKGDFKKLSQDINDSIKILSKSWDPNVVIFSVDMSKKKAWIWNEENCYEKIQINLLDEVVIVWYIIGSDDKRLVASKVDIH